MCRSEASEIKSLGGVLWVRISEMLLQEVAYNLHLTMGNGALKDSGKVALVSRLRNLFGKLQWGAPLKKKECRGGVLAADCMVKGQS